MEHIAAFAVGLVVLLAVFSYLFVPPLFWAHTKNQNAPDCIYRWVMGQSIFGLGGVASYGLGSFLLGIN